MAETKKLTADEAYNKAQASMDALVKNANNPHFKSKFADLDKVIETCRAKLHDVGFSVQQFTTECAALDGVAMVTRLRYAGETYIEDMTPLILQKRDMQGLGAAQTYARRYGLLNVSGLAPVDDDGEGAVARGKTADSAHTPSMPPPSRRPNGGHKNPDPF